MSRQRVLILGTNDVIGARVARALASSNWATPVVLASEAPIGIPGERISAVAHDRGALEPHLVAATKIVAAFAGSPASIKSNAAALFTSSSPWQQKRIVHVSSMTVYGEASGEVGEDVPFGSVLTPYAQSRVESENLASSYPNVVTLRPGCEYGPECGPWSERVARWLSSHRLGDLGAHGDGYCNLVYIDDVVAAVMNALHMEDIGGKAFNLAMPLPPTWNDYFIRFAKALGAVPAKRISHKRLRFETKVLAPILKAAELAARRVGVSSPLPPAIPPSALAVFRQDLLLNSRRASDVLQMNWTPLDIGLRHAADAYLRIS
jgi:nucleoside-diphosphate-sugar epimerase